jgi:Helix-turn-helix domain
MSAIQSFFNYLSKGNTVTTRQARTMFKVSNVSDLAYRLRNDGIPVYTNRVVTSRGEETFAYRIGSPSKAFAGYIKSGHKARARKALYAEAFAA